jgi:hypothetical protein
MVEIILDKLLDKMQVPFFLSQKRNCAQAAMMSALKVRLPEREFSFEELNELTRHEEKELTLPTQIVLACRKLGVPVEYFIKDPMLCDPTDIEQLRQASKKFYGEFAENLLSSINLEKVAEINKEVFADELSQKKPSRPPLEFLLKKIDSGRIPIVLLNYDSFLKVNRFGGHYIPLVGYDSTGIIYHNSGPSFAGANKHMLFSDFNRIRDISALDWGVVII